MSEPRRSRMGMGRRVASCALAACALVLGASGTQDAIANGDTRTLELFHAHTQERLRVTFRRDGSFDSNALTQLNHFLRDWRNDDQIAMAPQLFDIVWYVYREVGASEPIKVVSAYRSPNTNAMLARRSRAVAKNSHHMRGNAMDFHIPASPWRRFGRSVCAFSAVAWGIIRPLARRSCISMSERCGPGRACRGSSWNGFSRWEDGPHPCGWRPACELPARAGRG